MTSSERNEERNFILECIQVYRDHPALWEVKCDDYMNRIKKNYAYDVLLKKYQEHFPTATLDDVKKKFNSLRTNYRKELKKEIIHINLELVQKTFISRGILMKCIFSGTKKHQQNHEVLYKLFHQKSQIRSSVDEEIDEITKTIGEDNGTDFQAVKKPIKRSIDQRDELLSLACKRLCESESEELQITKTWANELLKMNKSQQIFAKKGIADILFEGTLNRDSIQINTISSRVSTTYSYTPVPHQVCLYGLWQV